MLRRTTILVLVLLSSEIHGSLVEQASLGNHHLIQSAAGRDVSQQYVRMEADGTASVFLKIDMRLILERLDTIPKIGNAINVLIQKIDQLIVVIGGSKPPPMSIYKLIIKLEKLIISRINQQDTKLTAIIQLLERIGSQVGSIIKITTQTLTIVQNIQPGGGGGGGKCDEQFRIVERLIQQIMNTLVIIQKQIENISPGGGQLTQILQLVQQNVQIVQQNYQILQRIENWINGGGGGNGNCGEVSKGQIKIIEILRTVISLIEKSTTQIITIIQGNFGGGGQQVLVYIKELIQLVKTILADIEKLRVIIIEKTTKLVTTITEQKEEIYVLKRYTKEQTTIAKSAASAAISASRAMKCPDGSKPLVDPTHASQRLLGGRRMYPQE